MARKGVPLDKKRVAAFGETTKVSAEAPNENSGGSGRCSGGQRHSGTPDVCAGALPNHHPTPPRHRRPKTAVVLSRRHAVRPKRLSICLDGGPSGRNDCPFAQTAGRCPKTTVHLSRRRAVRPKRPSICLDAAPSGQKKPSFHPKTTDFRVFRQKQTTPNS